MSVRVVPIRAVSAPRPCCNHSASAPRPFHVCAVSETNQAMSARAMSKQGLCFVHVVSMLGPCPRLCRARAVSAQRRPSRRPCRVRALPCAAARLLPTHITSAPWPLLPTTASTPCPLFVCFLCVHAASVLRLAVCKTTTSTNLQSSCFAKLLQTSRLHAEGQRHSRGDLGTIWRISEGAILRQCGASCTGRRSVAQRSKKAEWRLSSF